MRKRKGEETYFSEEPCDNVSKDNGFVGLVVVGWRGDTGEVPEISLPLVHPARQLKSMEGERIAYLS